MVLRCRTIAVRLAMLIAQQDLDIVRGREAKHRADDELPVLPELAIVEEVREPAIVIAVIGGDLRLQLAFDDRPRDRGIGDDAQARLDRDAAARSEENTSDLQSLMRISSAVVYSN